MTSSVFFENYTIESLKDDNAICLCFHHFSDFLEYLKCIHKAVSPCDFKITQDGKGAESKRYLKMTLKQEWRLKLNPLEIDTTYEEDYIRDIFEDLPLKMVFNRDLLDKFVFNYESILISKEASDMRISFKREEHINSALVLDRNKGSYPWYKFEVTSDWGDFEMNLAWVNSGDPSDLIMYYEDEEELPEGVEIALEIKIEKFIAMFKTLLYKAKSMAIGMEHEKKICVEFIYEEVDCISTYYIYNASI